jgi:small basic protein
VWYLAAGLLLGVILGLNMPWEVPAVIARYLAVSLLAGVDTSFGGLRASLEGDFSIGIFVSGFIVNAVVSAAFVYIGDILGIELYLAAIVAMGVRIFNNLGIIRRYYLRSFFKRQRLRKNR